MPAMEVMHHGDAPRGASLRIERVRPHDRGLVAPFARADDQAFFGFGQPTKNNPLGVESINLPGNPGAAELLHAVSRRVGEASQQYEHRQPGAESGTRRNLPEHELSAEYQHSRDQGGKRGDPLLDAVVQRVSLTRQLENFQKVFLQPSRPLDVLLQRFGYFGVRQAEAVQPAIGNFGLHRRCQPLLRDVQAGPELLHFGKLSFFGGRKDLLGFGEELEQPDANELIRQAAFAGQFGGVLGEGNRKLFSRRRDGAQGRIEPDHEKSVSIGGLLRTGLTDRFMAVPGKTRARTVEHARERHGLLAKGVHRPIRAYRGDVCVQTRETLHQVPRRMSGERIGWDFELCFDAVWDGSRAGDREDDLPFKSRAVMDADLKLRDVIGPREKIGRWDGILCLGGGLRLCRYSLNDFAVCLGSHDVSNYNVRGWPMVL